MRSGVRFDAPGEHPALATFVPRKADAGQYAPRRAPVGRIDLALKAAEKSRSGQRAVHQERHVAPAEDEARAHAALPGPGGSL